MAIRDICTFKNREKLEMNRGRQKLPITYVKQASNNAEVDKSPNGEGSKLPIFGLSQSV